MQDYAKPISTSHRSKSSRAKRLAPKKRLGSILIGLIVIMITAVVLRRVIFSEIQPATVVSIEKKTTHIKQIVEDTMTTDKNTQSVKTTTSQHPRFAFYNMLPRMQVEMVTVEVPAPATGKRGARTSTEKTSRYILQIASFRERADAKRLQKQLEKNSELNVHIDEVNVTGVTWYRVQAGPFNNLTQAQAKQQLLQESYNQGFIRHYAKNQP